MTLRVVRWSGVVKSKEQAIRPEFDRSIMTDFQRAKITSGHGFPVA